MARKLTKSELKEQKDLLSRIRAATNLDFTADKHNREAALDALYFINGEQWIKGDKEDRQNAGRPVLTIDRINPAIDQAVGDERQNCPAIKIRAADKAANSGTATAIAGLIREIETHSQAKIAYTKASEHQKQCGFGYIRVVTDYENDNSFNQVIKIEPIYNQFAVLFDGSAVMQNKEDADHLLIYTKVSKDVYKKKYSKEPQDIGGIDDVFQWRGEDEVVIGEWYEKEYSDKTIYLLTDGRVVEKTGPDDVVAVDRKGNQQVRKVHSYDIYRTLVDGAEPLEEKQLWPSKFWPIVPVYGKEIDINGKTYRRGIVKNAMDSQRMYNYYASAAVENFALTTKSPWLVTPQMIKGFESMWANANRSNVPYLPVNPVDPTNVQGVIWPQKTPPAQASSAIISGLQQSADDIRTTTGRHLASLGAQSNETSGVAIQSRQREGDVGDYAFTDNMAMAIKQVGRVIVDLIPAIYDTNRIIKTVELDGTAKEIEINQPASLAEVKNLQDISPNGLLNDFTTGKYEVEVDVGPSYTTQRQETAQSMLGLIQAAPAITPVISDVLVKNMDWPGAEEISYRLKAMMMQTGAGTYLTPEEKTEVLRRFPPDPASQQPPPPDPNMVRVQAEVAEKQARLQMDMDLHELEKAQKLADIEKTKADGIKSIAQAEAAEAGPQIEMYKQILSSLGIQLDHQKELGRQALEAQKIQQIGAGQGSETPSEAPETPAAALNLSDLGSMAGPGEGTPAIPYSRVASGGGGTSGTMPVPGRAMGGPVSANQPYIVGEQGPEMIIPAQDGMVVTPEMADHFKQMHGMDLAALSADDPRVRDFIGMYKVIG